MAAVIDLDRLPAFGACGCDAGGFADQAQQNR